MDFLDTIVKLREEYRSGRFQEEYVLNHCVCFENGNYNPEYPEPCSFCRASAQEEIAYLRGKFCPSCGAFNRKYPEPCFFCMVTVAASEAQLIADNRERETRCVWCGIVNAYQVCVSCWGK